MSSISKHIQIFSPEKQELLCGLLSQLAPNDKGNIVAIPGRRVQATVAQERLWRKSKENSSDCSANMVFALSLRGECKVDSLIESLDYIFRRHDSLRTYFIEDCGKLYAQVAPGNKAFATLIDLEHLEPDVAQGQIEKYMFNEKNVLPFDLSLPYLFRIHLFKMRLNECAIVATFHHAIFDGWSEGVFIYEVQETYNAKCKESVPRLSNLPFQFSDFARWKRNWERSRLKDEAVQYWRRQLADCPPLLTFSSKVGTQEVQVCGKETSGNILPIAISSEMSGKFERLCAENGASAYMGFLSVFSILLSHVAGQDDIVIGSPIAGRNHKNLESLIGFLANVVPIRVVLSEVCSFKELITKIRQTVLEALAYQELSIETLVKELNDDLPGKGGSLYKIMFALQNTPSQWVGFDGIETLYLRGKDLPPLQPIREFYSSQDNKLEFTFALSKKREGYVGLLEYDNGTINNETAIWVREGLSILLDTVLKDSSVNVLSKSLLPTLHQGKNEYAN